MPNTIPPTPPTPPDPLRGSEERAEERAEVRATKTAKKVAEETAHDAVHEAVHETAHETGSRAGAAGEALRSAAHAAEEFAAEAVLDARRSIFRHWGWRGLRAAHWILRSIGVALLIAGFGFGAAVLTTRYVLLPNIGHWRGRIETAATAALHAPVTIGRIDASWAGLYPRLVLENVQIRGPDGRAALSLPKVDAVVSWASLLAFQPRMHALTILAPTVAVDRLADHRWRIGGIAFDPRQSHSQGGGLDWLLAQRQIRVLDARVRYTDESGPPSPPLPFTDVNLSLDRGLFSHRFALQVRPPSNLAGMLDVRGRLHPPFLAPNAPLPDWEGHVDARFRFADLASWGRLLRLVPSSVRLDRARGSMRLHFDFAGRGAQRIQAKFALAGVDVRLRPDLQPLRLDRVAGLLTASRRQTGDADVQEIRISGLRLTGGGRNGGIVTLPPTNLVYFNRQFRQPEADGVRQHIQLRANRLALGDLSRLAALIPLPRNWQTAVRHAAVRGTLENLKADWDEPVTATSAFQMHTQFSQLGLTLGGPGSPLRSSTLPLLVAILPAHGKPHHAQTPHPAKTGRMPAIAPARRYTFDNLSGSIDAGRKTGSTEQGTLRIDAVDAGLRADHVLIAPRIAFDRLTATLHWRNTPNGSSPPGRPGQPGPSPGPGLQIDVDSLTAANADLAFEASGRYRAQDTAAPLDVQGRILRARLAGVAQYLPANLPKASRRWLTGALQDGQITRGRFHLQGNPRKFPFADPSTGDFQASLHVVDGRIETDPTYPDAPARVHWPAISGIDADVNFDRNRLTVQVSHALAYQYPLTKVVAHVEEMEKRGAHLRVEGQGAGDLRDLLRYAGASPVNAHVGGWLAGSRGSGPTRVDIRIDIPLATPKQTRIVGGLDFQGDTLTLLPALAPFTTLAGHLDYTARSSRFSGLQARFLGGKVRIGGGTLADGALLVHGTGTATPQGARRQVPTAFLRRVVDHTQGTIHYTTTVTVRHGLLGYQIDSDLVGLTMDLPAPLNKKASMPMPLRIALIPEATPPNAPREDLLRVQLGNRFGNIIEALLHQIGPAPKAPAGTASIPPIPPAAPVGSALPAASASAVSASAAATAPTTARSASAVPPIASPSTTAAAPLRTPSAAGTLVRIDRGAIGIGTAALLPRSGVTLRIDQQRLDVDQWRAIAAAPAAIAPGSDGNAPRAIGSTAIGATRTATLPAPELGWLDTIHLHARQLRIAGRSLADVTLNARRDDGVGWIADLASDEAAGSLRWMGADPSAPAGLLTARLIRLTIPAGQQKQVSDLLDTAPRNFPALDIVADQFRFSGHRLGRLELKAKNVGTDHGDTWILERLVLLNRDGRITASGRWARTAAVSPAAASPAAALPAATVGTEPVRRKMDVSLVVFYTDAGHMLGRFGYPGLVRSGKGTLKGHLAWIGSPFAIDYPSLTGTLHDETDHGQFLHADLGAARLLGVLSLQSLGHRLTGDFRDLFAKGFAFDSLSGTATIANGTLTTDDFIMKGLNAAVRVRGSADLRAETQNLTVVVIPEISAGTASLAYAALINPAIGLGAFIANYLLRKPLSEAFTVAYAVTGPWSHPQVQQIDQ